MAQTPERRVILEMDNITKTFPGVKALSDVTFDVREHEIHAICGENGAGKSTLMKVLSGVHPHGSYSGRIVVEGKEASYKNVKDSEKDGIVVIQQELALSPHLSIAENIFLGNERSNHGVIDWDRTKAEAKALMTKVGLNEKPETIVSNIGVGKQQLVEIAKALGKDVKVLILDEPTAALNDDDSQKLLDLIVGLKESGISCVIISHKLSEIRQVADRVTVIRDGQTITTHDMHGDVEVTEGLLIRDMVGRSMDNRFPDHVSKIGEEVMRVENWAVTSPITGRRALHDVSFNVRAGEIVGIAGLMGAGRTELAMSLFGKSWGIYEHGDLYLHDKKVALNSVRQAINAGIAYASEDRKRYGLNLIGAIKHNMTVASMNRITKAGVISDLTEYELAEDQRKKMRTKAESVDVKVGTLSGGNQQKVVLSKWLLTEPDVLILDEPTRGIDVGAKYEIYTLINELADAGKAVVVISSELVELIGLCDRIYTLSFGRITGEVAKADATQEVLMSHMMQES
ncbi:ABC transporter ATP-binding protein [Schaalia turicensis]|uniref:ABC transporter ATP-binding protein n=1 Tax=Schaalia turicensis TaxID=131111 RepID=A0A2I1I5C4_9ACTO|nr:MULTISPECIES: sugar ABC transporter ATP-binding protein [Actinomycetaceae]MDK6399772.1 sugar ABC transporter ATP-binding protein [Pauljensenia sp. UMB9872]MDK7172339.1 sugar ABC transporter ATP-binding protein [Pauljensenia sp. UMB1235]PKY66324.1 ABC transporter ATP-binding protein [Schaalia turicensis]